MRLALVALILAGAAALVGCAASDGGREGETPSGWLCREPWSSCDPDAFWLVVASGEVGRLARVWSLGTRRIGLTDGLMLRPRPHTLFFGRRTWAGLRGRLYLGPPYGSSGGMLANHLIFRWRVGRTDHVISLHAWEPLTEAAAVLRGVVASAG